MSTYDPNDAIGDSKVKKYLRLDKKKGCWMAKNRT